MAEEFTQQELSKFGQLSHQLLTKDGDFSRIAVTLISSRRLYSLAAMAMRRFADSEPDAMGPRFAEYMLEAMKVRSEKGFNLNDLTKHTKEVMVPFISDEMGREHEQSRSEAMAAKARPSELYLRWALNTKVLEPGQVLVLHGPAAEVDARLLQLLGAEHQTLFLGQDAAATPIPRELVTVLDHRDEYQLIGYRAVEFARWDHCCQTPAAWKQLLMALRRESEQPSQLLVLRNFHLSYSSSSNGEATSYSRKLGNALRVLCNGIEELATFPTIVCVYTSKTSHSDVDTKSVIEAKAAKFNKLLQEAVV